MAVSPKNIWRTLKKIKRRSQEDAAIGAVLLGLLGLSAGRLGRYAALSDKERRDLERGSFSQQLHVEKKLFPWTVGGAAVGAATGYGIGYRTGVKRRLKWAETLRGINREAREARRGFRDSFRDYFNRRYGFHGGPYRSAYGGTHGYSGQTSVRSGMGVEDAKKVLGIPGRIKTKAEAISLHRKLVKQWHPDVAQNKAAATEKMAKINDAWNVYKNSNDFQKLAHLLLVDFAREAVRA